jgi:hypothetical protein
MILHQTWVYGLQAGIIKPGTFIPFLNVSLFFTNTGFLLFVFAAFVQPTSVSFLMRCFSAEAIPGCLLQGAGKA